MGQSDVEYALQVLIRELKKIVNMIMQKDEMERKKTLMNLQMNIH